MEWGWGNSSSSTKAPGAAVPPTLPWDLPRRLWSDCPVETEESQFYVPVDLGDRGVRWQCKPFGTGNLREAHGFHRTWNEGCQAICAHQFYVSTWLGSGMLRQLVKHYFWVCLWTEWRRSTPVSSQRLIRWEPEENRKAEEGEFALCLSCDIHLLPSCHLSELLALRLSDSDPDETCTSGPRVSDL